MYSDVPIADIDSFLVFVCKVLLLLTESQKVKSLFWKKKLKTFIFFDLRFEYILIILVSVSIRFLDCFSGVCWSFGKLFLFGGMEVISSIRVWES